MMVRLRSLSFMCCTQSLGRQTRNVLQLGLGFFFIFLAFNSQGFIEESVLNSFVHTGQVNQHAGYTSLSIIYATFTVLNFIAPALVKLLGTRSALVFGGSAYVLFLAGFLHVNQWFLYASSVLLGLGAAVIWTAQGKYLTLNSNENNAAKHSSLFLALSQACLSCGGLFLLVIFLSTSSSDEPESVETSTAFSPSTVFIIYSSFTGIAMLGVLILALLPQSASRQSEAIVIELERQKGINEMVKKTDEKTIGGNILQEIKSIFTVAATAKMVALALAFSYTGILLSFWSSIFPTAIINTAQFRTQFSPKVLIALNGIVKGFGQPLLSLMFRLFHLHRLRPSRLVLFGVLIHLTAFALCFVNLPNISPLEKTDEAALIRPRVWLALLSGFLLSFGDACWCTQIFSFMVTNYPTHSAEAFALFKFYQSLFTSTMFYLSGYLQLHWHLLILVLSAIIGYIGFVVAEKMEMSTKIRANVIHPEQNE